jgi:glycosyltransferase involved in cell wall biosynthesis
MISVLLPCYNGGALLRLQLEALVRQTWAGSWELLYLDNGSTDGSLELVQSYADRLPLRVVSVYSGEGPRRGVARSYALGFAAARGDAVVTCEADDEVDPGYLAAMATALEAHPFVVGALDYQRLNPPELAADQRQQRSDVGLESHHPPLFLPCALGCAIGLQRRVWETIGDPDEALGVAWDQDYCWRAQLAGFQLTFEPKAVVHYRLRQGREARQKQAKAYAQGYVRLWAKHGSWPAGRHARAALHRVLRSVRGNLMARIAAPHEIGYWDWDLAWSWSYLMSVGQFRKTHETRAGRLDASRRVGEVGRGE